MSGMQQALLVGHGAQPLDIAALFGSSDGAWFDFTDAAAVFSDVGGTTPATLGSVMRSIRTKGPATPLIAVASSSWPWTADANGIASADKAGTEDYLGSATMTMLSGGYSEVALYEYAGSGICAVMDSDNVSQRSFQGITLNGTGASWQTFGPSNVVGDAFGVTAVTGARCVTSFRVGPTVWSGRVDRASAGGGALSRTLPSGYSASIWVGAASLASGGSVLRKFNGRIYCAMIINRYLSDDDVLAVETEMLRVAGMA